MNQKIAKIQRIPNLDLFLFTSGYILSNFLQCSTCLFLPSHALEGGPDDVTNFSKGQEPMSQNFFLLWLLLGQNRLECSSKTKLSASQKGAYPCGAPWFMSHHQKWKGINRKQSTRWQHLSRLKASAFFSLQIFLVVIKHSSLYLGLVSPSGGWQSLIRLELICQCQTL